MKNIKQKVSQIKEEIDVFIIPMVTSVRNKVSHREVSSMSLRAFTKRIDPHVRDVKGAMNVLLSVVDDFKDVLDEIAESDNNNDNVMEVKIETVENITNSVDFIAKLILTEFKPPVSNAEKEYLNRGVASTLLIIDGLKVFDFDEVIDGIGGDVPVEMIKGLSSMDDNDAFSGFSLGAIIGKISYNIGKMWKQRQTKRLELLKAQRDYLRLELLDLETNKDYGDTSEQKEYYQSEILELTMEIDELKD